MSTDCTDWQGGNGYFLAEIFLRSTEQEFAGFIIQKILLWIKVSKNSVYDLENRSIAGQLSVFLF